jgi:hypothetical protein
MKKPVGSHQVPNMFPKVPMCSPNMFSIAPHFYPKAHFKIEPSILGSLHSFFLFLSDWPMKLAHWKKN